MDNVKVINNMNEMGHCAKFPVVFRSEEAVSLLMGKD